MSSARRRRAEARRGQAGVVSPAVPVPAVPVADGLVGRVGSWPATGARGPMPPRQPRQFNSTLEQFSANPLAVTPRLRPMPPVASLSSVGTDQSERGKPALLAKLQKQLDAELARHELGDGDDGALLRVYGQCWDQLADEFTLYRPLLLAIKGEYERFIAHYDAEIARLQPTVEQIDEREAERTAVCAKAELECAAKRDALRLEVKEALTLKREKEAELKRVRAQLKDMSIELGLSKMDLKNLHNINLGLCDDIKSNEHKVREIKTTEERDRGRFPVLKAELDELKGKMQDIDDMMQHAAQKLSDVDDELAAKNAETRSLSSKLNNLTVELSRQQKVQKDVKSDLRESRRKVGALQRLLTSSSERPHTPRVEWENIRGRHESLKDLNIEQPSALVVNDLVAHMHVLYNELEAVRDKLPWVQAEKKQKQMMAGKWFVCRGTAPSVPKFLRMQGKVRNRNMQKRDCEQLIKEFWREKTKHNQSKAAGTVTVSDFLYNFLKSKYGVPAAIAEAGYNLIDALTRYQYDADCELFEKIIFGELCEETYYDQVEMMDGFIDACKAVDKKKNGKKGGRLGGTLKRHEFIETLKSFFKFKSIEDIALLQQAVIYDQPLPMIKYMKLFDETRDGDQGKFAETLRDQHLYDSVACYPAIENAIREEVMKNDPRATAEGACVTTLKIVMAGLHKYDEGLATAGSTMTPPQAPEVVLQRIVACGLGEPVEKWPFSDFRKVDVEEFCQRLRALVIKRYSVPAEEDAEQKAAKALRSMLPEERKLLEEVFAQMDADYSGYLSRDEIGALLEEVYGSIVDDNDQPGEYIGGSFTPHDFTGAPEDLVVLVDSRSPSVEGHDGKKELCATLDQNIPDIKTAVEVLQSQLSSVWIQPPVRSTRNAKRSNTSGDPKGPASSGSTSLQLNSVKYICVGDSISGAGICAGTKVVAVDSKKNTLTLSAETGAFDARGEPKDKIDGVMDGGFVYIDHINSHLVGSTSGVITLTSCTVDEYSSVELVPGGCGPHALALLEDPGSAPGQVIEAKQSQLKEIVKQFDLNNDNCVTLDEFLRAVVTVPELKIVGDVFKWKKVFDTYDADNSGEVDKDELELMVHDIVGTKAPDNETAEEQTARKKAEKKDFDRIMKLLLSFDTEGNEDGDEPDGLVTWDEFLAAMKQLNSDKGDSGDE